MKKCSYCRKQPSKHPTPDELCKQIRDMRAAMKSILTWSEFSGGVELLPDRVAMVCKRVLNAS